MSARSPPGVGRGILFRPGADPHPVRAAHRAVLALAALQHRQLGGRWPGCSRWSSSTSGSFDLEAALIFAGVGLHLSRSLVSILSVRSNEQLGPPSPAPSAMCRRCSPCWARCSSWASGSGRARSPGSPWWSAAWRCSRCAAAAGGRRWPVWVLALPLAAALVRGAIQPAIKTALALWHEPLAAAAIGYTLSTVVILSLVGRRALARRAGRPHGAAVVHRRRRVQRHGDLPSLCRAWPGLDHAGRAAGRAVPADRRRAEPIFLRGETAATPSACWESWSASPASSCCCWRT